MNAVVLTVKYSYVASTKYTRQGVVTVSLIALFQWFIEDFVNHNWRCILKDLMFNWIQKHFHIHIESIEKNRHSIYQTNSISFSFQLLLASPIQTKTKNETKYYQTKHIISIRKKPINNQSNCYQYKPINTKSFIGFPYTWLMLFLPPFKQKKVSNLFFRHILSLCLFLSFFFCLSVCPLCSMSPNLFVVIAIWKQQSRWTKIPFIKCVSVRY